MKNLTDAELIIGLVGRIGVETKLVSDLVSRELHSLHYDSKIIKITDYFKIKDFNLDLKESPLEDRYKTYIEACNEIRNKSNRPDFFITYAVSEIQRLRLEKTKNDETPALRTAYIIDQLKRPEELFALRKIYGDQFILISAHIPMDIRKEILSRRIAEDHSENPRSIKWETSANELIERDENESNEPNGQRVADTFHEADLILDASKEELIKSGLKRFFEALFGNFAISPSKDEFFQNLASTIALTSCDTSRQVGAVISVDGEICSTGFNEAPKAGGGTYWPSQDRDGRDFARGRDVNAIRKRQMVIDIVERLFQTNYLKEELSKNNFENEFLDRVDAPLKKSQIMDTLEFGRAVHAEMAAISSAARTGRQLKDGVLYCTTFPCHNCAKHIVSSGIKRVLYLEPYEKSYVFDLYPDSICIDVENSEKVKFKQFIGITPRRYNKIFEKGKMKDSKGRVLEWKPKEASPLFGERVQEHISREIIFQKEMREQMNKKTAIYLALDDC